MITQVYLALHGGDEAKIYFRGHKTAQGTYLTATPPFGYIAVEPQWSLVVLWNARYGERPRAVRPHWGPWCWCKAKKIAISLE